MKDHFDFTQRWQDAQGYDATRNVLRDAAHDMIRAGGIDDLSMRGLAARLGASAMAPYRYYPSKHSLVEDVRRVVRRDFATCLQDAAASAADPVGKFRDLCSAYVNYALHNEEDYRLLFGALATPLVSAADALEETSAWQVLVRALESLPSAGHTNSTFDQAHLVWATLHGIATLHLSRRLILGRSADQLGEPLVRFLLAALHVT